MPLSAGFGNDKPTALPLLALPVPLYTEPIGIPKEARNACLAEPVWVYPRGKKMPLLLACWGNYMSPASAPLVYEKSVGTQASMQA